MFTPTVSASLKPNHNFLSPSFPSTRTDHCTRRRIIACPEQFHPQSISQHQTGLLRSDILQSPGGDTNSSINTYWLSELCFLPFNEGSEIITKKWKVSLDIFRFSIHQASLHKPDRAPSHPSFLLGLHQPNVHLRSTCANTLLPREKRASTYMYSAVH